MSIWVPTSYISPTMLSVRSQLLPSSNSTFPTLGEKSSKMSIFLPINQNSDSTLKLNPTRQHESMGMLGFQNRAPDTKLLKFHINQDNRAYLEKHDFQWKLIYQFWDRHLICTSKQVQEWSWILIPIPSWPCTQNETKFLTIKLQIVSKNVIFFYKRLQI